MIDHGNPALQGAEAKKELGDGKGTGGLKEVSAQWW